MNSEFNYEIVEELGVISERSNGWKIEINKISWNEKTPVYDIRMWNEDRSRMGKGISMKEEEVEKLCEIWKEYKEKKDG